MDGLSDGNWIAFALACQWLSELLYVLNTDEGPPCDLMSPYMEGFGTDAAYIQLAAIKPKDMTTWQARLLQDDPPPPVHHFEPKVPFRWVPWPQFEAAETFDVICLARSPGFTPVESDVLFDEIRDRFIDEAAFG
jgi:hypothetical protein